MPRYRTHVVERPRLHARLAQQLTRVATLVQAPAGYGKTTLVASWLQQAQPRSFAWLSLDDHDNDPMRFLRYLTAALQTLNPTLGADVAAAAAPLGTPSQPLTVSITSLINDLLQLDADVIVVLDDYHVIENEAIHDAMRLWLENMPSNVHLIMTTRVAPPLPFPKLRVRHQLHDITVADLQFTRAEATHFLKQSMQLQLSDAQIEALEARTEGWVASLQLIALALQGNSDPDAVVAAFGGDDQHVVAYLLSEVMTQLDETVRQFLLDIAILSQFNAALCDVVTGRSDSGHILAQLEQQNLFISSLGEQRHWYRLHPLLAEFLQSQQRQQQPQRWAACHARAARWFDARDEAELAIDHALAGGDTAQALAYLQRHGNRVLWQEARPQTLYRWLEQLDRELWLKVGQLAIWRGWALVFTGRFRELIQYIDIVEAAWAANPPEMSDSLRGQYATLKGELRLNRSDIAGALEQFELALSLLDEDEVAPRALTLQAQGYGHRLDGATQAARATLEAAAEVATRSGNTVLYAYTRMDLAETLLLEGRLSVAEATVEQLFATLTPQQLQRPTISSAHMVRASIQTERNQLSDASGFVDRGLALTARVGSGGPVRRYGYLIKARILRAQGDWPGARRLLDEAVQLAQATGHVRGLAFAKHQSLRLCLLQSETAGAEAWLDELDNRPATAQRAVAAVVAHDEQVTVARFRILQADWTTAERDLKALRATAESRGWGRSLIEIDILLALAAQRQNRLDAAIRHLTNALTRAEPEQYVRLFVDEGAPMAQLLRVAVERGILPAYIGLLQAAFMPAAVATQPLLDPLTKREQEVLRLLAQGLSNPEIAREMIVATGTVAKYTNNIFSKLGVRNRTEAATRARAMGLLDSIPS